MPNNDCNQWPTRFSGWLSGWWNKALAKILDIEWGTRHLVTCVLFASLLELSTHRTHYEKNPLLHHHLFRASGQEKKKSQTPPPLENMKSSAPSAASGITLSINNKRRTPRAPPSPSPSLSLFLHHTHRFDVSTLSFYF